ncbi:carbohydrate binding domain-containing protein [Streptomyces sp. B6B3]|uniref:carbohydrate binding domain-containing protein n=1 Tax=Streptomyces sp. B6B3 TaxID=3153570 RepID=UPI00325D1A44
MSSAHWKPLPEGLPPAARELAEHLRTLLDDHGVSLRQLANDADVHYSLTTLHRYFSGQALPPAQLIGVLADRYGGGERLHTLLERAGSAEEAPEPAVDVAEPAQAGESPPETDPAVDPVARAPRRRTGLLIAVALALLVGVIAGAIVNGGSDPEAAERPQDGETAEELVFNGDFGTGRLTPWWEHGDLTASLQDGEMRIDVPGGTEFPWEAMVGYSGLGLREGEHYTLTFTAHASSVAPVGVTLLREGKGDEPELETHTWQRSLGPAPQTFTFPFVAGLSSNAMQITLRFGGGEESLTAFLDDVSLTRTGD